MKACSDRGNGSRQTLWVDSVDEQSSRMSDSGSYHMFSSEAFITTECVDRLEFIRRFASSKSRPLREGDSWFDFCKDRKGMRIGLQQQFCQENVAATITKPVRQWYNDQNPGKAYYGKTTV